MRQKRVCALMLAAVVAAGVFTGCGDKKQKEETKTPPKAPQGGQAASRRRKDKSVPEWKPERFEAASEIADHLKEKRTVVVNLESTHKDIARRLIDFLSGVAYAGEGKIKKVAANTYIITPYHVDIEGDLIDELENNGLYF